MFPFFGLLLLENLAQRPLKIDQSGHTGSVGTFLSVPTPNILQTMFNEWIR